MVTLIYNAVTASWMLQLAVEVRASAPARQRVGDTWYYAAEKATYVFNDDFGWWRPYVQLPSYPKKPTAGQRYVITREDGQKVTYEYTCQGNYRFWVIVEVFIPEVIEGRSIG